jgi:hypothetical protein
MGSQKKIRWHRTWTKQNLAAAWSMGKNLNDWDDIIDWCKLHDITPREVFNWVAGKSINKTDEKTIKIVWLYNKSKSKLSPRGKAISLSKQLIEIDKSLAQRSNEEDKHWQERIYQRVFKALQRGSLD